MESTAPETPRIRLVTLASLSERSQSSLRLEMALPIATRHLAAQVSELEAAEEHFRSLADPLHKRRGVFSAVIWISVFGLVFAIWLMFNDPSIIAQFAWLVPVAVITYYFVGWPRWQHTARAKRWVNTRKPMPPSIEALISNLRAGWSGTNGVTQNEESAVLNSAIASLLCSPDEHDRRLVRSKTGQCCSTITVLVEIEPHESAAANSSESKASAEPANATLSLRESGIEPMDETTADRSASEPTLHPSETTEPEYSRVRFAPPRAGLKSSWVTDIGVTPDELLDRIAMISPPPDCTIPVEVLKVVLGTSLTTLLKPGEDGRLTHALAAGKQAVKAMGVQAYSSRESDDWIRKLIAPPLPWIQQQLSTSLRQTSLDLLGGANPRLP